MDINPNIFKSYDIRGIYPTEINEENFPQIIKAIYAFFKEKVHKDNFTVAVGRDMRISSPKLTEIAIDTLVDMGANVVNVGLLSTPTFYFAVSHYAYDTGIQITASHNPKDYNGVKFVMNSPHGLIKVGRTTGMEDIKRLALEKVNPTSQTKGTVVQKSGILEAEVENALQLLGNPTLSKFKIVADPANAMGATYLEALFQKVPAELVKMNFELDGSFPVHQPDPLQPENLVDAKKKVLEVGADLGLVPDGDGDRMMFIDEKGELVPPTIITALVAKEMLKEYPGSTILFDIRYILTPEKIVAENGGKSYITKVGHAFITEDLAKTGGIFAGESSGHYYLKATGNAESQVAIVISVLKVLSQEKKKMSEITAQLRRSYESGEINFEVMNAKEIIQTIKTDYHDGQLSELDGIAISYPQWRFSMRTSNTEPLLRLNVEALTESEMQKQKDALVAKIKSLAK